ncbi:MAG TPA: formylglycine-generating enzyme family protein, partial [Verrucomicrobiae bacterium]|nr:formylglycine-generating enzyme family protein [Verrucomicrobiae bacterium]
MKSSGFLAACSCGLALALMAFATAAMAGGSPEGMVVIPAGVYRPLMRGKEDAAAVPVKSFYLDVQPVSNGDFLEFVRAEPQWRRSNVRRIFADATYLKDWVGDLDPGSNAPAAQAVVNVSWFAAKAFAKWHGKRLPTVAEWELAADASPERPDGGNDPRFKAEVLKWYCQGGRTVPADMKSDSGPSRAVKNFYGVRALHGFIWEWVEDFNSAVFSSDSRSASAEGRLFCGAGAQSAQRVDDYPAFMRFAFRSSLRANYCIRDLGFRCARDL